MSLGEESELHDLVKQTLEKSGSMSKLRVKILHFSNFCIRNLFTDFHQFLTGRVKSQCIPRSWREWLLRSKLLFWIYCSKWWKQDDNFQPCYRIWKRKTIFFKIFPKTLMDSFFCAWLENFWIIMDYHSLLRFLIQNSRLMVLTVTVKITFHWEISLN